jgi:hypothetical protein
MLLLLLLLLYPVALRGHPGLGETPGGRAPAAAVPSLLRIR